MPIVKAQCPNCNGTLEIDNAKDAAICPFCDTPYVVEKAINNFITQNQYSINHADINIVGEDIEKMISDAEVFLYKLKDIEEAKRRYTKIVEKYPSDYRGWWGLSEVYIQMAEIEEDNYNLVKQAEKNAKNAMLVAPEEMVTTLNSDYNKRVDELKIIRLLNDLDEDINHSMEKIKGFENRIKAKSEKPTIKGNLITIILLVLFVCASFIDTPARGVLIIMSIVMGAIVLLRNVLPRVENAETIERTTMLLNREKENFTLLMERKEKILNSNNISDEE